MNQSSAIHRLCGAYAYCRIVLSYEKRRSSPGSRRYSVFNASAAAYVRGSRLAVPLPDGLSHRPFSTLTAAEMQSIVVSGLEAGLQLRSYQANHELTPHQPGVGRFAGDTTGQSAGY